MIGSCNCPITGFRLQSTVRLQLCRLEHNSAVYAPITLEEIVITIRRVSSMVLITHAQMTQVTLRRNENHIST